MTNDRIKEILNSPDVSDLLDLWVLFCEYSKGTSLKINFSDFMSYLVVMRSRLNNEV